jgi:hypothetical protein
MVISYLILLVGATSTLFSLQPRRMLRSLARSVRRLAPLRLAPHPASLLRLRCVPPVPAPCGAVACLAKQAKGGKGKGKGKGKVAKQNDEEQPV